MIEDGEIVNGKPFGNSYREQPILFDERTENRTFCPAGLLALGLDYPSRTPVCRRHSEIWQAAADSTRSRRRSEDDSHVSARASKLSLKFCAVVARSP
jgi:hypothetical protein